MLAAPRQRGLSRRGAADAHVREPVLGHVFGPIDVAQIDHDGVRHQVFEAPQIEGTLAALERRLDDRTLSVLVVGSLTAANRL